MIIGGIDLGGTKIETRAFDADFREIGRNRIETPRDYPALIEALAHQVRWLEAQGPLEHVGLGSPGLINPVTGRIVSANLPMNGQCLGQDLFRATGRKVPVINDSRAFALSEARFGAGQSFDAVVGLVIGTGVAGGLAVRGSLATDLNGQQGEFGHLPLPAELVARHGLPVVECGCGMVGCFETLMSGPGLVRLADHIQGDTQAPHDILLDPAFERVRMVWFDIVATLVAIIARAVDPQVIVLGGGLGAADEVPKGVVKALDGKLLTGTSPPSVVTAAHGGASGALGAAVFAWQVGGMT